MEESKKESKKERKDQRKEGKERKCYLRLVPVSPLWQGLGLGAG